MRKMRIAAIVPIVASTMLAGFAPAIGAPSQPDQLPLNSTGIPDKYANQQLAWHQCTGDELPTPPPPGAEGIECATFTAPRNWHKADEQVDVNIAVSRLKATGGAATGSVMTNPGGPGGPGRNFPARLRKQDKLRAQHDIIGMDPRGTGKSTNITCGGAIDTTKPLDPRDRSEANINLILDATQYAASSCQAKSGELGPLINTDETTSDIDLLRVLLGREKLKWVGYSAGTWLGAHYAQKYPQRADKFVLDSNTEFTTTWQKSFDWQPMGFERRWREDFLPWLAKYDAKYHFGADGEATRQSYELVRHALTQKPVTVDGKEVGPNEFDSNISSSIYDKSSFPDLAQYLVNVRTLTNGAPPEQQAAAAADVKAKSTNPVYGPQPLRVPGGYDDAYDASFWTIPCNEGPWTGNRQSAVRQSDEFLRKDMPLLGAGWLIQPCIFWNRQPEPLPVMNGAGVNPVLMVQSTHDPATPIEGAQRAHQAFRGSRMLTVTGEGDHGIYAGGNQCVDTVVENYLVDGVVPDDSSCPGMPLPEPKDS